jgi:uncharacterized membrane protein YfcA
VSLLLAATITGFAAGILGGLLGLGGGAILVPIMVFGMGIAQHMAQGISMMAIVPTTIVSAWYFNRDKLIDYHAAKYMALGAIAGALLSSNIVQYIPGQILTKIFGVFAITLGIRNFIMADKKKKPTRSEVADESTPQ